jgi:hypothetical protein
MSQLDSSLTILDDINMVTAQSWLVLLFLLLLKITLATIKLILVFRQQQSDSDSPTKQELKNCRNEE